MSVRTRTRPQPEPEPLSEPVLTDIVRRVVDRINFASGPLLKTPADVTAAINGDPTFERHVLPV